MDKIFISRHSVHQHWYTSPIALKSIDCRLNHFYTRSGIACDFQTSLTEFLEQIVNRFTRKTLPTVIRKSFFINILCIQSFCPQKKQSRTVLFGRTLLKHCCHFYDWNQHLNMCMRVCYLDSREVWMCCYLVLHIENLLHPLQPIYFYLWLSLVHTELRT
jgi:hypothetical protein